MPEPSEVPAGWLHGHTFHHTRFSDWQALADLKRRRGLSLSVVFPTLNEAATIGTIVGVTRRELQERTPLVDEIWVVDSGSTDGTLEIAAKAGARTALAADVLPAQGSHRGKGENLWKSLYLTQGDIILWCDADIRNFGPRFVAALAGPLIENEQLEFAKAFYQRPLHLGNCTLPQGGGRVTELLVRPLLSQLCPELSLLFQPLSGEYALRRRTAEQLPFYTGYSVEIGLLLELHRRCGMEAICQIDLEKRVHRNQNLAALSRMAQEILATVLQKVEDVGSVPSTPLSGTTATSHIELHQEGDQYWASRRKLQEVERPAIVTLPEYRAQQGTSPFFSLHR